MLTLKRIIQGVVAVMLLAGMLISCRKDPATVETPVEINLTLSLQNSILSVDEIDSANVVLTKQGSASPGFQRMIKGNNFLQTSIDGLSAGQWTASFDLYTKKFPSGRSFQYVASRSFTVAGAGAPVTMNGPSGVPGDDWKTRMVLADSQNEMIVLVSRDATDPYFEIRTKDTQWNFFGIERLAFYNNALVAYKIWSCTSGCPRLIFNNEYFLPFTEKIKTSEWTRSEIIITIGNTQKKEYYEFEHIWNY